jgi:hypothetical protein
MQIVYWAHSYRPEDGQVNDHFGLLIKQAAKMFVNLDPPSKTVNSSKLVRNLLASDGMVAVLTWRPSGPSPYILYEISLALRARKPLVVFIDDRLPDGIVPRYVLQRRFSARTYFHQVREHTQALRFFKEYIGDPPPVRYQPSVGQRSCGLIGMESISDSDSEKIHEFVASRGYKPIDVRTIEFTNPLSLASFENIASLELILACADSLVPDARFWMGTLGSFPLPAITFTGDRDFAFDNRYPLDFQPRTLDTSSSGSINTVLDLEFGLFEQNFLSPSDQAAIERYTQTLIRAGSLDGHYEAGTRATFMEVIMGDQYNTSGGQIGAQGPNAHAHDMTFQQIWNQSANQIDFPALAGELSRLQTAMENIAKQPSEKFAAGAVAVAAESAQQKDGPKVIEYLKAAGKWALSVAQEIGVDLAADVLKTSLGM